MSRCFAGRSVGVPRSVLHGVVLHAERGDEALHQVVSGQPAQPEVARAPRGRPRSERRRERVSWRKWDQPSQESHKIVQLLKFAGRASSYQHRMSSTELCLQVCGGQEADLRGPGAAARAARDGVAVPGGVGRQRRRPAPQSVRRPHVAETQPGRLLQVRPAQTFRGKQHDVDAFRDLSWCVCCRFSFKFLKHCSGLSQTATRLVWQCMYK